MPLGLQPSEKRPRTNCESQCEAVKPCAFPLVLEVHVVLEVSCLDTILDGGDEAASVCAIHDLVIVGERQVAHLADSNGCLLYTSPSPRDS